MEPINEWTRPAVIVSAFAAVAATISACAAIVSALNSRWTRRLAEAAPGLDVNCTITPAKSAGWYHVQTVITNPTRSRWRSEWLEVTRPRGARLVKPLGGNPTPLPAVDLSATSNVMPFGLEIGPHGTGADQIHHFVNLCVPPMRSSSFKLLLRLHCVSLDAIQRRCTIDIHRTLMAHSNDDTAQKKITTTT